MPLAFYFDQHVPAAIARALRLRGVEVLTAYEDRSDRLQDEQLLLRAAALGRISFAAKSRASSRSAFCSSESANETPPATPCSIVAMVKTPLSID